MSTERRPNFFIVGAQKSGTSALTGWLRKHPQVFMSFPKEPGYLAFLEAGYPYPDGYGRRAPASEYIVSDEKTYLDLFSAASERELVIGEASTWYFSLPGMAQRIKNYSPDAKILVILRNPVDRAYSAWSHARKEDLEPCDEFSAALEMEEERGEVEFLLRYRRMGMYSDALSEYQEVFGPSQLMVLFYEDLLGEQGTLWRQLCAFLEIDPLERPPPQRRLNQSGIPRSVLLQRIMDSHRLKKIAMKLVPYRLAVLIKEKFDGLNMSRRKELDEDLRAQLREEYRTDIEKLALLTGRNLDGWLT